MPKKTTLGRLAGTLVVLAGLVYGPGRGPALAAKPTPHPTYPPVPLVVTVESFDSDGNACRICGDGLGAYENGYQGVLANIDAYGNVIINFNAADTPVVRKLRFDYSQPVDSANTFRPPASLNSYLATGTHPAGSLQVMNVGDSQCINSNVTFQDVDRDRTLYRNNYRREVGGYDFSGTSYLVVTRVNADVWELEPKSHPCNIGNATVAKLLSNSSRGGSRLVDRGDYYMPFKMTLTRQQ